MTVREYRGARYVPVFMGEWSDQNAYEPLSIVINQGNSYTSRQAVPIGVSITDTAYWALTGNYNAQVEAYRREVARVTEQTDANTENIATNTENIATNTADIEMLENRNAIILGDSWNAGFIVNDSGQTTSDYNYSVGELIKGTGFFNRCYLNADYGDIGTGNTGFACNASTGRTFYHWLDNIANNMPDATKETITDIIVIGGINDATDSTLTAGDLYTYINRLIQCAKTNFPNSKMHVFPVQSPGQGNVTQRKIWTKHFIMLDFTRLSRANGYTVDVCEPFSRWFIGNAEYFPTTEWNKHDIYHGTNTCMMHCASKILQHLVGGDTTPYITVTDDSRFIEDGVTIVNERCFVRDNTFHWCGTLQLDRSKITTGLVMLMNANPMCIDTTNSNYNKYQGTGILYGNAIQTWITAANTRTTQLYIDIPSNITSGSQLEFNVTAPWGY